MRGNKKYFEYCKSVVGELVRGTAWLDTDTFASLQRTAQFVEVIKERQGSKVSCFEEMAFQQGWINIARLQQLKHEHVKSEHIEKV